MNNYNEFYFSKPLNPRLHKNYIEQLALLILKHCCKDKYSNFYLQDSPDIQSPDHSIGIEVTEAISKEDAQINGEYTKYTIGKNSREEKIKCTEKIIQNGGKIDFYGLTYPVKNSKDERDIFQKTIQNKNKKLPLYRQQGFKEIGLFIYYDEPPIPFKLETLQKWIDEVQAPQDNFDFLYLCYPCGILYYDFSSNPIQPYVINRNDFYLLQETARINVENLYSKKP